MPNGVRSDSPSVDQADRAISPNPPRPGIKPANGVVQQPFPNAKGRAPPRPSRSDDDMRGYESEDAATTESAARERALSPDQRAKSPTALARSMSPEAGYASEAGGQPMNMAALAMSRNGGLNGRSPSPNVDRSKAPPDAFYQPGQPDPSPVVNGFGHGKKPSGSTGNITADLIRDLKAKEAEMDAIKKREGWLKAALAKAKQAGFVYNGLGATESGDVTPRAGDADKEQRAAEIVINLQQLKAQIQVCSAPLRWRHTYRHSLSRRQ
jgi:hypothetical protein